MKKRRFIQFIIIYFVLYLFVPIETQAYSYVEDDCLKKNTCMLVCSYYNTCEGNANTTGSKPIRQRNISIYYVHKSHKWIAKWETTKEDRRIKNKSGSFSYVFHATTQQDRVDQKNGKTPKNSGGVPIYTNIKLSENSFTCPKYGYLDMSSLMPDNELCFDNDGKYCKGKSNVGTAFDKKASKFKSKGKDYDYATDVKKYFQNWVIGDIKCDDLVDSSSTLSSKVQEKVVNDFKTNFLKGNKVPEFIQKNSVFTTGVKSGVEKRKNECVDEIKQQQKEGKIDEKTAKDKIQKIEQIDADEIQDAVDDAKEEMNAPEFDISKYNQSQTCTGIFGDPTKPESIAYLIQKILNYIKIAGPILVILLSSVDFIKVIWTSDDDSMKKAQQKLVKRLVAAVLLFLLPSLISLMFNLINNSIIDPTCGIK